MLLSLVGSPLLYLAIFTRAEDLRRMHAHARAPFDRIKQIDDHEEFLSSFEGHDELALIVDPWVTPEGRIRYRQIALEP